MLPNINGIPAGPEQKRINWIRNGDFLTAAETSLTSEGNLNAAGVQLQENIVYLDDKTTAENADTTRRLKHLEDVIDASLSLDVVETLNQHTDKINTLEEVSQQTAVVVQQHTDKINSMSNVIGMDSPTGSRSLKEEDTWIKTEMGNWEGQTIDGVPSPGAQSTGMKRRILDNTAQSVLNRNDIGAIRAEINLADLPQIKLDVAAVRLDTDLNTQKLDDHNLQLTTIEMGMDSINDNIGANNPESIDTRVTNNKSKIDQLDITVQAPITGLVQKVADLENAQSNTSGTLEAHDSRLRGLENAVGDSAAGLVKDVSDLQTKVGTGPNSLETRFAELQSVQNDTTLQLQDLQSEIGTGNTGLTGQVALLVAEVNALKDRVTALENKGP